MIIKYECKSVVILWRFLTSYLDNDNTQWEVVAVIDSTSRWKSPITPSAAIWISDIFSLGICTNIFVSPP